jgi:peptide/nickel transport system ATP-binding protein
VLLITHDLGVAAAVARDLAVMYAGRIVEKAPARRLLSGMRMPYTQAIVEATPRLNLPPHTRLKTIDGVPPNLIRRANGCDFAPRCVHARDRCNAEKPPIQGCGDHTFACWYPLRSAHGIGSGHGGIVTVAS